MPSPTLNEFEAAQSVVARVAKRTPVESSALLTTNVGSPVYLKCENLQRTGSFKLRGAYYTMARLTAKERAAGVVAASAGNHAQGVAFAARELGIAATIFMPVGVALPKLEATRGYGAQVVLLGADVAESLEAAAEFARTTGAVLVPPFDDHDVITGQGTVGLEILEQLPDVDTICVPVGGGGLLAGVASAAKQRAAREGRAIQVIGVQAESAACYPISLSRGEITSVELAPTIADGIAVARPGSLNFDIVRSYVDAVVTVDDSDVARALLLLLERAKLVVEPAGAVGVAAIMDGRLGDLGKTVVVLSGGNVDPLVVGRIITQGLATSSRYLKLRVMLSDRPGELARATAVVSAADANVVEVGHTRWGAGVELSQVELDLSLETRGRDHADRVRRDLQSAGFEVHE